MSSLQIEYCYEKYPYEMSGGEQQRKEHETMVKINGEEKALAGQNLLAYLQEAGFEPERVVVERNFEIVPKEQLAQVVIQDEDVIEVLRFVGGG